MARPHHKMLLTSLNRRSNYEMNNEDRIILKDGVLYRNYYAKTAIVKNYQTLTPKQSVKEVLRTVHEDFKKDTGITLTENACRLRRNHH